MINDSLLNPFGVDPAMELPHQPQPVPLWTEFCYFFAYDADAQMGISIHAGTDPSDPRIWRATIAMYLPGEDLLVAKYCGRDGHSRGAGAGPLRITCVEPMRLWTVTFDGLCQATTRPESMSGAHRDSPHELASFCLTFDGAAPLWDIHARMKEQSWGSNHWEQICTVRGSMTLRGETTSIAGTGVRDHSCGPRDYGPVISNFWTNMLFPDGTAFQAQLTRSEGLGSEIRGGYIFRGDGSALEVGELVDCPDVGSLNTPKASVERDPLDDPSLKNYRFVLKTKAGLEEVEGELLHSAATTYVAPNDELLGTDFTQLQKGQPRVTQLTESPVRYRWRGMIGYGGRERIARIDTLK